MIKAYGEKWDTCIGEFKCDLPVINCSSDNVLHEIVSDKGKKYREGNTDLFIFVLEDELKSVNYLLQSVYYNSAATSFLKAVAKSPFDNVFLCVWNFEKQEYNVANPIVLQISKCKDDSAILEWKYFNVNK